MLLQSLELLAILYCKLWFGPDNNLTLAYIALQPTKQSNIEKAHNRINYAIASNCKKSF